MLNSIGLDNDGIEAFIAHHLPYLATAWRADHRQHRRPHARRIRRDDAPARRSGRHRGGRAEHLVPERLRRRRFRHRPDDVRAARGRLPSGDRLPIIAKLTPNVTSMPTIAKAAEAGGADAISLINTCLGMAIDWRRRRPMLGNVLGGLSGPAIKPIALRAVYQAAQAVKTPIIGIGGIATIDDVMEFLVAGASAVQLGTVNFYNPRASMEVLDALPAALAGLARRRVGEVVGTLTIDRES